MDLVNLFSNINMIDISSIIFDFKFNIEGDNHDSGLVYDINDENVLEDQFLFGLIHQKMDQ